MNLTTSTRPLMNNKNKTTDSTILMKIKNQKTILVTLEKLKKKSKKNTQASMTSTRTTSARKRRYCKQT